MDTITNRLSQEYRDNDDEVGTNIVPLHEEMVGSVRPALLILLGAVGLLLLVACANAAGLSLARSVRRRQELALRLVLGAGRLRLIRLLTTEHGLTALAGGVGGLALASWSLSALAPLIPTMVPRSGEIDLDWNVLAFTLVVTLFAGLLAGLTPALSVTRGDLGTQLKTGQTRSTTSARHWTHRVLTTSQISLAVVLLITAGLFNRSFQRLLSVDPGFDPQHVLTFSMNVPFTGAAENLKRVELYRDVRERITTLPGVEYVGASTTLPLTWSYLGLPCEIEGRPAPISGQKPMVAYDSVTPGYFRALGATLIRGRYLTDLDTREQPGVLIINQTMARRFWPGEDPIGRRLTTEGNLTADEPMTFEIVGIIKDIAKAIDDEVEPKIYVPCAQDPWHLMQFVLRTTVHPLTLVGTIREEIAKVTQAEAPYQFSTMDEYLNQSIRQRKLTMLLVDVFALVALALAAAGIYGILSYSVSQRTHEIGLRMALGAQRGNVLRLILRQGSMLVVVGLAIGLATSLISSHLLSSQLFGITPYDSMTFVSVPVLLAVVALSACYVPARRAANLDPMVALRCE